MSRQSTATGTSSLNSHTNEVSVGPIGHIKKFHLKEDNFSAWVRQFELYVTLNKIDYTNKKLMFLALLGTEGCVLLKCLCRPKSPIKKKYDILKTMMLEHLNPPQHVLTARRIFKERKQGVDEPVGLFVVALQKLAKISRFGTNVDSVLRNQLVNGIIDVEAKRRILLKPRLSFNKCVEICLVIEDTLGHTFEEHRENLEVNQDRQEVNIPN